MTSHDLNEIEQQIALLRSEHDEVWEQAVAALARIGEDAVEPLIDLLATELTNLFQNDYEDVCLRASDALVLIGPPAVLPLTRILNDSRYHSQLRAQAAELLGDIGDPRAVDALIELLLNKDNPTNLDELRDLTSAMQLDDDSGEHFEEWFETLEESTDYVRETAADSLGRLKDNRAVEPLINVLNDQSDRLDVRDAAITALGDLGDPRAVEPLIEVLKEGKSYIRQHVAEALGELADERAIPALLMVQQGETHRLFEGRDAKEAAARAIESIKGRLQREGRDISSTWYGSFDLSNVVYGRAVEPFLSTLTNKGEQSRMRCYAAEALGQLGDWRAVDPLVESLMDIDNDLRWYVSEALGRLGDERAISALRWLAQHDTGVTTSGEQVRTAAASAVQRITQVSVA